MKDSLDKVGLKGAADRYPAQLSGGALLSTHPARISHHLQLKIDMHNNRLQLTASSAFCHRLPVLRLFVSLQCHRQIRAGMKKRAALARAIISDDSAGKESAEEVVMYDEPTVRG